MGFGSSLYGVYRVLRLSMWCIGAAAMGKMERDEADRRAREFARSVLANASVELHVVGADKVPRDRPFVYMSNHQSMFDIPVLWAALPARTLRFVAKTELFDVPIWGRAMRLGEMVEVDRRDRKQAIASLRRAAELIHSGISVWIAPEGHRSTTGALGPLKKGGFHLALDAGVDIVPVAVNGTIHVLAPHALRVRKGKRVDVVIGDPIPVAGSTVAELMDTVSSFFGDHVDPNILSSN